MKIPIVICTFITLAACGGAVKAPVKIINDEVSTPMTIEDVEATEDGATSESDAPEPSSPAPSDSP